MFSKLRLHARKGFYHDLYILVLPIVIQNLISSSVSMADVLMLGRVDQTVLSASSLAGQVQFLLNIVYFGLNSALTILASQYWGKKDRKTIARILGIGLVISLFFGLLAMILALSVPGAVMSFWTNVDELIEAGSKYLRFVALSYLFAAFSQPYLSIMKSCERVKLSTTISVITLLLNVVLNAVLIFGFFGLPKLGIVGAALATAISRFVEFLICAFDYFRQKIIPRNLKNMFTFPKTLLQDFGRYSAPALINDIMWGLAYNMYSVIMGHLGTDIVAANSIAVVVRNLFSVVGFGISAASSIMLGNEIGKKQLQTARKDASSILGVTLYASLLQGILLLAFSPLILRFAKLSDTAVSYLRVMLWIGSVYQIGVMINTVLISSFFRCGGDSRYGMKLDIIFMWFISVPLGYISAFVLNLPPLLVYAVMCTDEFLKMPLAIRHYRKTEWIRDLTRDY